VGLIVPGRLPRMRSRHTSNRGEEQHQVARVIAYIRGALFQLARKRLGRNRTVIDALPDDTNRSLFVLKR
jgi:hypothetical protein